MVILGNNIDILKQYPDNYFDAVVTDPPYGLGKEPDANLLLKDWLENGFHEINGSGFMGKEWDAFVPQPLLWKEVFRVLKHGGHAVAFYGTRTYDWGVLSMRLAGFEIRDCIQWIYGSGFPKSHNISKALDKLEDAEREVIGQNLDILKKQSKDLREGKRKIVDSFNNGSPERNNGFKNVSADITAPATESAKQWEGWGSALKPANEPIVLARKPLEKGLSIAENVLKWGTGGINIDGCRVECDWNKERGETWLKSGTNKENYVGRDAQTPKEHKNTCADRVSSLGRFPANVILTHHPECECKGVKKIKPSNGSGKASEKGGGFSKGMFGDGTSDNIGGGFTDENGEETIEDWYCHPDCPIKIMDEQSEGASRFFYCAKASKSERNKGLNGFEEKRIEGRDIGQDERSVAFKARPTPMANIHPTVKPIKLMQYLARMVTPPNGIVLDLFCGSGTTGVACKLEGFQFVGIEQDPEYCKIAEARIQNFINEQENTPTSNTEVVEKVKEDLDKYNQGTLF